MTSAAAFQRRIMPSRSAAMTASGAPSTICRHSQSCVNAAILRLSSRGGLPGPPALHEPLHDTLQRQGAVALRVAGREDEGHGPLPGLLRHLPQQCLLVGRAQFLPVAPLELGPPLGRMPVPPPQGGGGRQLLEPPVHPPPLPRRPPRRGGGGGGGPPPPAPPGGAPPPPGPPPPPPPPPPAPPPPPRRGPPRT